MFTLAVYVSNNKLGDYGGANDMRGVSLSSSVPEDVASAVVSIQYNAISSVISPSQKCMIQLLDTHIATTYYTYHNHLLNSMNASLHFSSVPLEDR